MIKSYNYSWKQYKHHGKETIDGYTFTRIPPIQFEGRWNMKIIKLTETIPWHTDWNTKCAINYLLNDDFQGGDFTVHKVDQKLKQGDLIMFPSYWMFPHGIKTVTKGSRYSLITWAW